NKFLLYQASQQCSSKISDTGSQLYLESLARHHHYNISAHDGIGSLLALAGKEEPRRFWRTPCRQWKVLDAPSFVSGGCSRHACFTEWSFPERRKRTVTFAESGRQQTPCLDCDRK